MQCSISVYVFGEEAQKTDCSLYIIALSCRSWTSSHRDHQVGFFNCCLAAPWPALSNSQGGSLTLHSWQRVSPPPTPLPLFPLNVCFMQQDIAFTEVWHIMWFFTSILIFDTTNTNKVTQRTQRLID